MLLYNVIRSNTTPTGSQDFITLIANATRSLGIVELDAEGAGTSSAYTETGIYRVSAAGTTGGGAITAVPVNSAQPAAGFVANTTWSAQPTVSSLIHSMPMNSNGQRYYWKASVNLADAIWVPGGGSSVAAAYASIRPITISGGITVRVKVAEI